MDKIRQYFFFLTLLFLSAILWASPTDIILKGGGATFPYPLYQKWMQEYVKKTGVRISYQSMGSGHGIEQLLKKQVDFGATDAFLGDGEAASCDTQILHIPTCLGAVVIVYNLKDNPQLRLTPQLIGDIFLGKITRWSDPRLRAINKKIDLPDTELKVVHRSDSSGTSFIFTSYLSKISEEWNQKVGPGKDVRWPSGIGLAKNPGVVKFVKKIRGSIGYVELTYARSAGLPTAAIQNRSGQYISPSLEAISNAANYPIPADTRTLIIDTSVTGGYPISAFTWLIFYKEQSYNRRSLEKANVLVNFLWWAVHEGQLHNRPLLYGTLSKEVVQKAEAIIRSITYNGKKVFH